MTEYRTLHEPEINRTLFQDFIRRQVVTKCWRKEHGGLVHGAFVNHSLKGFIAVLPEIFGGENQYMDLAAIHVSQDMRNSGIGKTLFLTAKQWAKEKGAKKLYISAHSAVESQAFYKKMGCVEAKVYQQKHVEEEPFDCQLEVGL